MDPKLVGPFACLAVAGGALLGVLTGHPSEGALARAAAAPAPLLLEGSVSPLDVQQALGRVFRGAAALSGSAVPVSGDFNGDGIPDLALVVRPEPDALEAFNSPVPSWILEDPWARGTPFHPSRVEQGAILLAVIHGFGDRGWRDPEARQTYLLKGIAPRGLRARPLRPSDIVGPRSRADTNGDALEVETPRERGIVYWDGASYAYRAETVRTRGEGSSS